MPARNQDIGIIGGGILGAAVARAITRSAAVSVTLFEAESDLARHQTGHNSGVIHSGLYYRPGSLKARNCTRGREALYRYCEANGIAHERCGKIVVATDPRELPRLADLEARGRANGLVGIRRLTGEEIREREPHAAGIAGLEVKETGVVDYVAVTRAYAADAERRGAILRMNARLRSLRADRRVLRLETDAGEFACLHLINCAGLQSDRVARLCGIEPSVRIVPFRGEYYSVIPERRDLVRHLIYPVPDPAVPFLGVHFTRMIDGTVEAGPNAVLAWKREGYRRTRGSLRDIWETLAWPGFRRLAARYWRTALDEYRRSLYKPAFVRGLQRLVPEVTGDDLRAAEAGVRAQALAADGRLVDDFHIVSAERMIHVLNAPSPAATASLSIGETIAEMAFARFDLKRR